MDAFERNCVLCLCSVKLNEVQVLQNAFFHFTGLRHAFFAVINAVKAVKRNGQTHQFGTCLHSSTVEHKSLVMFIFTTWKF